jgi:hypothetical protein
MPLRQVELAILLVATHLLALRPLGEWSDPERNSLSLSFDALPGTPK